MGSNPHSLRERFAALSAGKKNHPLIGRLFVTREYQRVLLGSNPHSLRERFAAFSAGKKRPPFNWAVVYYKGVPMDIIGFESTLPAGALRSPLRWKEKTAL
ncbi:MAG: hypothetical protein SVP52_08150 [Chloroflexota bacterium]|nr:hypothetical protein [Chloroflexota bacterium]